MTTVRLEGARQLHDALGELKKPTERALLRRVAVKALEPVVERAKQLVPVDEGRLRDSIVIGTNLTSRAKRADKAQPKNGIRVFAGSASRNAVPREFGSVRSRPQPYMRPAWESEKERVLGEVENGLRDEIEKAAARAARKARR